MTDQHPARAEQRRIGAAVRASQLPAASRLIMHTAALNAAESAEAGIPFAITLTELADQTGLAHREVADRVGKLMKAGWIARDDNGHWLPTVPPSAGRHT